MANNDTTPATFREWMIANLADSLGDIASHGADSGWGGLTYTRDCVELFDQYGSEIWELAVQQAEDMGCKNVADMIAGFTRADMLGDLDTFKNLMVWFAAEEYARQITESTEPGE